MESSPRVEQTLPPIEREIPDGEPANHGLRLAEDLLPECERTGAEVIGFPQVRDWLLKTGISLGFQPLRNQLRMTRRLVLVVLVLLVLFPFALLLLEGVDLLPAK